MICIYHNADLDGYCSAAIVQYKFPECRMVGLNYGDPVPDMLPGEEVIIVDFSFGKEIMESIDENQLLTWIDHHKLDIDNIRGLRKIGTAACVLTWQYFMKDPVPLSVQLIGSYDVWDHKDPRVVPFQYGMRCEEYKYLSAWKPYFFSESLVEDTIKTGLDVITYVRQFNQIQFEVLGFKIKLATVNGVEHTGLIINGFKPSFYDEDAYDYYIFWSTEKDGTIRVSLRSKKYDVSKIARVYGGGGHTHAAGFQCSFELIKEIYKHEIFYIPRH